MAERLRRRRVKSDDDSEKSFSESDVEAEDINDVEDCEKKSVPKFSRRRRRRRVLSLDGLEEHSVSETDTEPGDDENLVKNENKEVLPKPTNGSEYESAEEEEDKTTDKTYEESRSKDQESLSELVDEEGGEEGIAETEDVEGDFLGEHPPDDDIDDDEDDDASEDAEYVEEERQQGDGEECSPSNAVLEKELDFDEDRRNPQYIPKKGIFYEHDDRNNEDVKEKEEETPRDRKKKLWLDEGKWGHDRFREEEQYPKSRHELIEIYGYDIRNEDGPPRARRRRRYGRGPTKYERNWEDVTAYGRERFKSNPRGILRGRRSRGRFRGAPRFRGRGRPQYSSENLDGNEENTASNDEVPAENDSHCKSVCNDSAPVINNKEFPALPTKEKEQDVAEQSEKKPYFNKSSDIIENKSVRTLTFENSNLNSRNSAERDVPPRRGKTPPFIHDRGSRKPTLHGNRGSNRGDYNRRSRGCMRHISPRFLENKINNLSSEMEHLSVEEIAGDVCNGIHSESVRQNESNGIVSGNTNDTEIPNMTLKGAGDSSGRPKRYSSLRQRSLPETNSYQTTQQPVPPPHPPYYETAGYQPTIYAPSDTGVPTPSTQSQTATSPPIMNPSAYQTFAPTPYTDSYGLRVPVTTPPPRLFPQATVPTGQAILAPPPCITPNPGIMNFAPPPPPAGYQFAYQQYATPPPPPPPPAPPSEIFQPGITYYYPQSQPTSVRPTVQKRPKAAIPIIPPPEREVKRNEKKDSSQPSSNTNRNFQDSSSDAVNVEVSSLRTESSSQLQTSVGVES